MPLSEGCLVAERLMTVQERFCRERIYGPVKWDTETSPGGYLNGGFGLDVMS